jgi:hypothetical protein
MGWSLTLAIWVLIVGAVATLYGLLFGHVLVLTVGMVALVAGMIGSWLKSRAR